MIVSTNLLLAWLLVAPFSASAAGKAEVDPRQALRSMPTVEWYDEESKSYSPPTVPPQRDNRLRRTGWPAKVRPPKPVNNNSWLGRWNWNLAGQFSQWFTTIIISLLAALLVATVLLLAYFSLHNYMPARFWGKKKAAAITIDPARVAELPFEVSAAHNDPLQEAERLLRAGKYNQAIVFLFGYLLLALDQARKIHLQKGKTNRNYLRELPGDLRLREILQAATLAFEDVYFGKHELTRERFMASWNQLDEFHKLLAAQKQPLNAATTAKAEPA